MTKVMPFGDQLRKPTSTWIRNACPMAGIRLITAAALAMTLMAGTATAATKPTPIAQKEAAVQAAQLAARAFVTVVKSKRQVFPVWSGTTLDDQWAPWWKTLAQGGHVFGSHTWDHLVWQADEAGRWQRRD